MKSRSPWAIMVRFDRSMTDGRTLYEGGGDVSVPLIKTSWPLVGHSDQEVEGALMAFCTSVRLK